MTIRSIWVIVGIVVLALAVAIVLPKPKEEHPPETATPAAAQKDEGMPTIIEVKPGKGRIAEPGDMVTVHYTLYLGDGKKIDSTWDRKQPYRFLLGSGIMVKGWEKGITGAHVGSRRKIIVPPELGYGARGSEDGKIPPNATLKFDVEVLKVEKVEDEPLLEPLLKPLQDKQAKPDPGAK